MIKIIAKVLSVVALMAVIGSATANADPDNTPPPASPPVQCLYLPGQIDALNARAKAESNPALAAQWRHQAQGLADEQTALRC